ncbi:hypothetical protein [Streptomyces prasinopilosus]|uniref:hypothetical protein n=1 Tax=Streptomyces prasinopilosus TaxID=67344 RepID=UPI00115FA00A|nr:hypothetical protein [Streptomyces prasinopilosus]
MTQPDAVAAWFVDVREERPPDRVLVGFRPGEHAGVDGGIGGAQDVLAGVGGEGDAGVRAG